MATNLVNLDALIQREDFFINSDAAKELDKPDTIRISDLQKGFFYLSLRKPDFQRETANWNPDKIVDFVKTFIAGDLIPAVIFWSGGEYNFVIDGAHRLSALMAWVHDDYGDGVESRKFFKNYIPPEQQRAAERTRASVNKAIGPFNEIAIAADNVDRSRPEAVQIAKRLGSAVVKIQWVPTRDASKAEASFFKINQAAVEIDPTELRILRARRSPNAIAARMIVRNATGHEYWAAFAAEQQKDLVDVAKEVYSLLYTPPLETPIKTLDLPIAGRGYSGQSLPLVFDLINLSNGIKVVDMTKSKNKREETPLPADPDGSVTSEFLLKTRKLTRRVTGVHASSLGLHPAVYFYSASGRHQPTSVLALFALFHGYGENDQRFRTFTRAREGLERFLLNNKEYVNRIVVKMGSGAKGFELLRDYYQTLIDAVDGGAKTDEELRTVLGKVDALRFLVADGTTARGGVVGGGFDRDTKSQAFLDRALEQPLRCSVCNGLLHGNSIHIDHVVAKRDGGTSSVENADLAHPYCNSTVKN